MNEEFREFRSVPDWWSRFIAVGSLCISAAAFYYAYLHERPLPITGETPMKVSEAPSKPADEASRHTVARPSDLQSAENPDTTVPAHVDEGATGSSVPIDWMSEKARDVDSAPPLASPADERPQVTGDTLSDKTDDTSTGLERPLEPAFATGRGAPLLATVRTMLKPTTDLDYANATVRNDGDGAAKILELIFFPDEVDEISQEAVQRSSWGVTDDKQLVIRFNDQDNRTSVAGRHGRYVRELQAPYVLEPGNSLDLKLLLENSEHVGYALVGKLTMRLAGADEFEIDRVAIPFAQP